MARLEFFAPPSLDTQLATTHPTNNEASLKIGNTKCSNEYMIYVCVERQLNTIQVLYFQLQHELAILEWLYKVIEP